MPNFIIDPRPIVDPELEFEADKSGMVHVRMHAGESKVLPGYGVTDFGVSPFEKKSRVRAGSILIASGVATAGLLAWRFRDTIATYALILRESLSEEMTEEP